MNWAVNHLLLSGFQPFCVEVRISLSLSVDFADVCAGWASRWKNDWSNL